MRQESPSHSSLIWHQNPTGPTSVALPPDALAALMRATVFAAASSVHPDDGSDTAEVRYRAVR